METAYLHKILTDYIHEAARCDQGWKIAAKNVDF